jgi:stage V sporulation protein B
MAIMASPILRMLYPYQLEDAESAAPTLAILAVGIVFLASIQTLTSVLQGVGKQMIPVINLFIGAGCTAAVTYILTGIPEINVRGAALGTLCAYVVATLLNFHAVKKYTHTEFRWRRILMGPLFSSIVMGVIALLLYTVLVDRTGNLIACAVSILVGILVYAVFVVLTRSVTEEELKLLPKSEILVKIYRKALTFMGRSAKM